MVTISVKHNLAQVARQVEAIHRRHVPFAASVALNRTAEEVRRQEYREIQAVIDRPTPWTLRSLRIRYSRKDRLSAEVWVDPWGNKQGVTAEQFLGPHIFGGPRKQKRFEAALRRVGIMTAGEIAVPGSGAPRDAYGNVPGGFIVRVLSVLRAFGEQGFSANATAATLAKRRKGTRSTAGEDFFVSRGRGVYVGRGAWRHGRMQNLPRGIWRHTYTGFGQSIDPIFLFVPSAHYRKRLAFFEVAQRTLEREFPRQFEVAMQAAIATAT